MDADINRIINIQKFDDCICTNFKRCEQRKKIVWAKNRGEFIHIKYDGCVCKNNAVKKSDCLIFFQDKDVKVKIYAIEVKDKNPQPHEVQEQIQTCLDHISVCFFQYQNKIIVLPVLCAEKYTGTIIRYLQTLKVKCFGKPYNIIPIKHGDELVSNTLIQ